MTMATYLINLDRASDRRDKSLAQLQALGLRAERVSAVDGTCLTAADRADYDPIGALAKGRTLSAGEIGCYLSHSEALRRFLASDAEFALVLEDDFIASSDLPQLLQNLTLALRYRSDWDVVNLGNAAKRFASVTLELQTTEGSHLLCRAHHFPVLTTALFWSRAGAQAFLDRCFPMVLPVDQMLKDWCIRSGRGLAFARPPVTASGAESLIDRPIPGANRHRGQRRRSYALRRFGRSMGNSLIALAHFLSGPGQRV